MQCFSSSPDVLFSSMHVARKIADKLCFNWLDFWCIKWLIKITYSGVFMYYCDGHNEF